MGEINTRTTTFLCIINVLTYVYIDFSNNGMSPYGVYIFDQVPRVDFSLSPKEVYIFDQVPRVDLSSKPRSTKAPFRYRHNAKARVQEMCGS